MGIFNNSNIEWSSANKELDKYEEYLMPIIFYRLLGFEDSLEIATKEYENDKSYLETFGTHIYGSLSKMYIHWRTQLGEQRWKLKYEISTTRKPGKLENVKWKRIPLAHIIMNNSK